MQTQCPQCGRMTNAARHKCMYCGKVLGQEIVCEKCQRPLAPGQARCFYCGTPASAPPPPKPPGSKLGPNVEVFMPPADLQGEELLAAIKGKIDQMQTPPPLPQAPSAAAQAALEKALDLFESGAAEQALQLLDRHIAAEPRVAKLYMVKGILLSNARRHQEALAALDHGLGLDPNDAMGWYHKADVLDELNRPQEAAPCYDKAIELNPEFVDAWADRGRVMERLGRDDLALACYAKVLELQPDSAIAWNNRGTVLVRQGQPAEALKSYQQAMRLDPNLVFAWINLGIAMLRLNKSLREVAQFYLDTLKRRPEHLPAALQRAREMARGQYYLDGLPLWEALAALKSQDKEIVSTRNRVRAEAKQEQAQGPQISALLRQAGTAETAKDWEPALQKYHEVLAHQPNHLAALLGVARCTRYQPMQGEQALHAWQAVLQHHPDNPEARAGEAGALIDLHRYAEGLATAERLCKLAPKSAAAWLQRGRALRHLERYPDAAKALRHALTRDPSLGLAWHELGLAAERLEAWPVVLKAWLRFLDIGEPPGFVNDIRKRRLPKAQKLAGLLAEGAQWNGPRWFAQAKTLEQQQDLEGADLCFTQAVRKDPTNIAWGVACGINRITLKRYAAARDCAQAILLTDPDNSDALAIKGNALFRLGEQAIAERNYGEGKTDPTPLLSEAAACLQQSAARSGDSGLLRMAGMALALAGRTQQAQAVLGATAPSPDGATLEVVSSEPQGELKRLLDAAGQAAGQGAVEQAVALYEQALALDPNCQQAMLEKGVGLSLLGRLDAALASFEQAARAAPKHSVPWDFRGVALARAGRTEEALAAFAEALRLAPDEPTVLIHQASTQAQSGRLEQARDGYRRVLALDSARIECWAMLGEVEERHGHIEQAIEAYRRYLAAPSTAPGVVAKLGPHVRELEAGLRQGHATESGTAAYERGSVLYNSGRLEEAVKAFQHALELAPHQIAAWNLLSMGLSRLGRGRDAAAALDKALKLFPEHAATWSNYANTLSDLGQHQQALECAERATRLDPKLAQGWGNKGRALAELGRLQEALPAFLEAGRLAPQDPMHAANYALTLAKLGRCQEALPIAEQAVSLGPQHPLAVQVYRVIRNELGD